MPGGHIGRPAGKLPPQATGLAVERLAREPHLRARRGPGSGLRAQIGTVKGAPRFWEQAGDRGTFRGLIAQWDETLARRAV